ncbi:MAG: polysaccharide deacetylase family protein [Ilumatobacter sp.]|nr:polysaccharide deacetylase family protein [Ilumatobacter sp.]
MAGSDVLVAAGRRVVDRVGTACLQPPRLAWRSQFSAGDPASTTVALTFDDGPAPPATGRTLDALKALDVKATFFVVGAMAAARPDLVRRLHDDGHLIGNHSMYHSRTQSLAPGRERLDHIRAADDAVWRAIGRRPRFYRPPWGWMTRWERRRAEAFGLVPIGWDIDAGDWQVPEQPASVTARTVTDRVRPGSVILMHDATSNVDPCDKVETAKALERIVERVRANGLEFARIDELTGLQPYRPVPADVDRPSS